MLDGRRGCESSLCWRMRISFSCHIAITSQWWLVVDPRCWLHTLVHMWGPVWPLIRSSEPTFLLPSQFTFLHHFLQSLNFSSESFPIRGIPQVPWLVCNTMSNMYWVLNACNYHVTHISKLLCCSHKTDHLQYWFIISNIHNTVSKNSHTNVLDIHQSPR